MTLIRPARDDDTHAIAEVYVETWRSTYAGLVPDKVLIGMSPEKQMIIWSRAIKRQSEIVLVAEDEQAGVVALGSAGRNRQSKMFGKEKFLGEVYTLYVHPDHQDLGIGRDLLAGLFRELVSSGLTSALIWVLYPNPSRFFYENLGGKRVGERDEKLWGATLHEIAYGWEDLEAFG